MFCKENFSFSCTISYDCSPGKEETNTGPFIDSACRERGKALSKISAAIPIPRRVRSWISRKSKRVCGSKNNVSHRLEGRDEDSESARIRRFKGSDNMGMRHVTAG